MVNLSTHNNELKAPNLPYYAWIEVDDGKAKLYKARSEGNSASAFVESRVGAKVVLCFRNEMTTLRYDLANDGIADGSRYDSVVWRSDEHRLTTLPDDSSRVKRLTGTRVGPHYEKPLMFVAMNYTDNPDIACRNPDIACRNPDVLRGLGIIKLTLRYGKLGTRPVPNPKYPSGPVDQAPVLRAHEPGLDMTERTALGAKRPRSHHEYYHWSVHGDEPVAELKFYYKSEEILQRRGYMPTPTTTSESAPLSRSSTLLASSPTKSGHPFDPTSSDDELTDRIRSERKRLRGELNNLTELEIERSLKRRLRSRSGSAKSD